MPTTTPTEPSNAETAEPTERTETEAAEPTLMPTEPIVEPIESTSISANNRPQSRPPKKKADTILNDVLMSVQNHFKRPAIREDRYDIFAKNIAIKMRELSKNQRIIAEKIINDTLFEGELGNLTLSHKLCNDNHTQEFRIHQQPQHSPIGWSTSSTSSNHAYSLSSSPVSATNSTQGICITQQPLEVNEQQGSNPVQLSIPDLSAANYFTNFRL